MEKPDYEFSDSDFSFPKKTEPEIAEKILWAFEQDEKTGFVAMVPMNSERIVIHGKQEAGIRRDYYIGRRGDLELYAHRYPAGFEIMFFQNVVIENKNGGRYDFDKFQKMPYIIRLRFMKYRDKIIALLKSVEDLKDESKADPRLAEEWIKARYVEEWHHEQKDMNFLLSDLYGQTQEPYNGRDRDKKTLHNGDVKYFRHWNGRLYRGRVYHNINNMWWVILDRFTVQNMASFELFDLTPEDNRRRQAKPRIPEAYQKRRKAIEDTKTRELINELRRRGVKVG